MKEYLECQLSKIAFFLKIPFFVSHQNSKMDEPTKNRNKRTPMLKTIYYFDHYRKMPYIEFCGMVLPYFILKNKMPIEINMGYDVREIEPTFNDKPGIIEIDEMVSFMDSLYKKFSATYFKIDEGEDYRENLVVAYFYQELAETIANQDRNENLTQEQIDSAIKKTKLYCVIAGLSTNYLKHLGRELRWQ